MKTCTQCQHEIPDEAAFCTECGAGQAGGGGLATQQTLGGMGTVAPGGVTVHPGDPAETLLEPGTTFAERYEIEGEIGQGGMGVVYRASDVLTGKTVALKLLSPRLIGSEEAVQRLISEGATAQDIRHENIVSVYDVGRAEGRVYVSMEYVEGPSLWAWIAEQVASGTDTPMRVAARIIAEMLDGLRVAHAKGVIHRDLKPENVILTAAPTDKAAPLKILDFGIARKASTSALGAGSSSAMGTFDYMAPEQRTNPDSAGPPADLYSVSKIFYQLLVGVLPTGHWQPPSGGRTDVPPGIDALIERGLSNRPQNRPQSAADYRQELVDAVNMTWAPPRRETARPATAVPASAPGPSARPGFPRWLAWGGGAMAGLFALVLVVGAIGSSGGDNDGDGTWNDRDEFDDEIRSTGNRLSALSGTWNDGIFTYDVSVSASGQLSGSATAPDGSPLSLSGTLSRSGSGAYTVRHVFSGQTGRGTLHWDGGCHVAYRYPDAFTGMPASGNFHIDHAPGGPCPPRLR